ncbi:MAG: SDR family oxidoreductase [Chloroflexota bacterium]|nr:SDR family oxidoreductase [Chloroflexota bacterium]
MIALHGQFAIVTGAAMGWGRAIMRAYAAAGMNLAIMDIAADALNEAANDARAAGVECLALPVDLSDANATQHAVDAALARFGTPRVVVHNAALLKQRSMIEIDYANWRREVDIILQAAFILSKAAWQPMIDAGGGSLVYISSGSALRGFVSEVAYTPAKHGQEGLMRALALEGEPFNIAVNTVTPGAPIHTPMSAQNYTDDLKTKWVDPVELTSVFVHLAGVTARDVTGQRLDAWTWGKE